MTAAVETHNEHAVEAHGHAGEHTWTDKKYVMVAVYLSIFTAVEVGLSYFHPSFAPWLPTVLLIVLMIVKFITVVLFFMHLRFDDKMFGRLFWSGLILAVVVYVAALTTFQFWSN
jgi:cytochrome c oxidase subunit IV